MAALPTPLPELLKQLDGPDLVPPASGSEEITKYLIAVLADQSGHRAASTVRKAEGMNPLRSLPFGMPMFDTLPTPRKIVQTEGLILMLGEYDNTFRQISPMAANFPKTPSHPGWVPPPVVGETCWWSRPREQMAAALLTAWATHIAANCTSPSACAA